MKRSCSFIPSFSESCLTIQNQAGLVKLCSNPQISPCKSPLGHCVAANARRISRGTAWEYSDGHSWTSGAVGTRITHSLPHPTSEVLQVILGRAGKEPCESRIPQGCRCGTPRDPGQEGHCKAVPLTWPPSLLDTPSLPAWLGCLITG